MTKCAFCCPLTSGECSVFCAGVSSPVRISLIATVLSSCLKPLLVSSDSCLDYVGIIVSSKLCFIGSAVCGNICLDSFLVSCFVDGTRLGSFCFCSRIRVSTARYYSSNCFLGSANVEELYKIFSMRLFPANRFLIAFWLPCKLS